MSVTRKAVWFNRISAVLWVIGGLTVLLLGYGNSVVAVWLASVYANAKTDWSTAAAEDNSEVMAALAELREEVRAHACQCSEPVHREGRGDV
jgi:hypothetical protein